MDAVRRHVLAKRCESVSISGSIGQAMPRESSVPAHNEHREVAYSNNPVFLASRPRGCRLVLVDIEAHRGSLEAKPVCIETG
jgi:hypothetical protein